MGKLFREDSCILFYCFKYRVVIIIGFLGRWLNCIDYEVESNGCLWLFYYLRFVVFYFSLWGGIGESGLVFLF